MDSRFAKNRLNKVDLEFSKTSVSYEVLEKCLKPVRYSRTVEELDSNLTRCMEKLKTLEAFKSCTVEVLPGEAFNSALVDFRFKDLEFWDLRANTAYGLQGGSLGVLLLMRNIRKKADVTSLMLTLRHNPTLWGLSLQHHEKILGPLEGLFSFGVGHCELDQNLKESSLSELVVLKHKNSNNTFEFGRKFRSNKLKTNYSSSELIQEALLETAKNYLKHTFWWGPVSFSNEFAISSDVRFHKTELQVRKLSELWENVVLESRLDAGLVVPWNFSKLTVNDKYFYNNQKGFKSIGSRVPSEENLKGSYGLDGDNLGSNYFCTLESKVYLYKNATLNALGLVPFAYGNLILRERLRGSLGFGIAYSSRFGKVELVYSAKVWKQPGDLSAEFQVLFSD